MVFVLLTIEYMSKAFIKPNEYFPIQLDITNACNLTCLHCYHSNHFNTGALTFGNWVAIVDQYKAFLDKYNLQPAVIFCGGEPTLSRHFSPILDYLIELFRDRASMLKIVVITNGTRPDRIPFEKLKEFDATIQVSFDGHNESTHDLVRGKGSFSKALAGIREIQRNRLPISILTILSKRTSLAISQMFDFAKSIEVSALGFTRLIGIGSANRLAISGLDRPLSPAELKVALMSIVIESARTGVRTNTSAPLFAALSHFLGANGKFGQSFVVDYRGKILFSSRSRIVIGDAIADGLEKTITTNELFKKIHQGEIENCGKCQFLRVCGGDRNAAFAAHGDVLGADPGCWVVDNSQNIKLGG